MEGVLQNKCECMCNCTHSVQLSFTDLIYSFAWKQG